MITADLSFLNDGHVHRWMVRHGMDQLVDEIGRQRMRLESLGIDFALGQRNRSYGSLTLTVEGGPTYHLRTRESPSYNGGRRDGAIYLLDAYRHGSCVATWRMRRDVRHWFTDEIERVSQERALAAGAILATV